MTMDAIELALYLAIMTVLSSLEVSHIVVMMMNLMIPAQTQSLPLALIQVRLVVVILPGGLGEAVGLLLLLVLVAEVALVVGAVLVVEDVLVVVLVLVVEDVLVVAGAMHVVEITYLQPDPLMVAYQLLMVRGIKNNPHQCGMSMIERQDRHHN